MAHDCYDRYVATGADLDPAFRDDLELQAKHFFEQHQLELVFLGRVVNWDSFVSAPNEGHGAIADFLCCKATVLAVSTNYDDLIERAAEQLGEKTLQTSLNVVELNHVSPRYNPLLKLHGCRIRNPSETIWCKQQLAVPPAQARIQQLSGWLQANLQGRDFVFLGFWSDWAYLNSVLEQCVEPIAHPTSVTVVDPAALGQLASKAPNLLAWAQASIFTHVQAPANDFLVELRSALSLRFFRESFNAGVGAYTALHGAPPTLAPPAPVVSTSRWYEVRRDICGVLRTEAVRDARPSPHMLNGGLCAVELNEKGVLITEDGFVAPSGKRVRIVGAGGPLSLVKAKYSKEPPALQLEDLVICAAATDDPGVTSVVRPAASKTIVRAGVKGDWLTLNDGLVAIEEGLVRLLEEAAALLTRARYEVRFPKDTPECFYFEDSEVVGVTFEFSSADSLLQTWQTRQDEFLRKNAFLLRRGGIKSWNTYCVLLCEGNSADPDVPLAIEEDFRGARKIVGMGVSGEQQVVRILLPLLPIQNQVRARDENVRLLLFDRLDLPARVKEKLDTNLTAAELVALLGESR